MNAKNQQQKPGHEPADNEELNGLLGEVVDISSAKSTTDINHINGVMFELYKETATVLAVIAHMYESEDGTGGLKRNQAICAALLIRIVKFMTAVMQLSAKDKRREVVFVLNRCMLESAATLEFLVTKNSDHHYNQFIEQSLGPERELYDV